METIYVLWVGGEPLILSDTPQPGFEEEEVNPYFLDEALGIDPALDLIGYFHTPRGPTRLGLPRMGRGRILCPRQIHTRPVNDTPLENSSPGQTRRHRRTTRKSRIQTRTSTRMGPLPRSPWVGGDGSSVGCEKIPLKDIPRRPYDEPAQSTGTILRIPQTIRHT